MLRILSLLFFIPGLAFAQTATDIQQSGKNAGGAPVITRSDMLSAFSTKADAVNGTLTSPTVNSGSFTDATLINPTILGATISGAFNNINIGGTSTGAFTAITVPTQASSDSSTNAASTAFVKSLVCSTNCTFTGTTNTGAVTSSDVVGAIGLYGGRQGNSVYTGTQGALGTSDYGLVVNRSLYGNINTGNLNYADLIINVDTVNFTANPSGGAATWWNVVGNVGLSMWKPSTVYNTVNQQFNNGGLIYKVATAGTSASSGGPTGTSSGITDGTVIWNYISPDFSGNRAGIQTTLNIQSPNDPATPNDGYRQWQASLVTTSIHANQGGSSTSNGQTAGFLYAGGDQMWAFSGATNLSGVVSHEFDVGIFTGASSYQRTGIQVVGFGDVAGAHEDQAYRMSVLPSAGSPTTLWAPGFKQGISVGYQSIDPAGWIVQLSQPAPGAYVANNFPPFTEIIGGGIDLFGFDIQTAALRSAGGLILDKNGAVNVGPAKIAATGSSVTLDAVGYYPSWTAGAPTNGGTSYRATERLTDSFGNIWVVTAVNGSGTITTLTLLTPAGTSASSSPSGAISLIGGTGVNATVTPTWTRVSQLSLNPSGGAVKFGSGAFAANGSVATALGSLGPSGSHTTVQEWFAVTDAAGTVRYIPAF